MVDTRAQGHEVHRRCVITTVVEETSKVMVQAIPVAVRGPTFPFDCVACLPADFVP